MVVMGPVSEFRRIPCPKPEEKRRKAQEYDGQLGFPDRYDFRHCCTRIGVRVVGKNQNAVDNRKLHKLEEKLNEAPRNAVP